MLENGRILNTIHTYIYYVGNIQFSYNTCYRDRALMNVLEIGISGRSSDTSHASEHNAPIVHQIFGHTRQIFDKNQIDVFK